MVQYREYEVVFEDFTERHFIKKFKKKYKSKWDYTSDYILRMCRRIDQTILSSLASEISRNGQMRLIKMRFGIYGLKVSPKAAGNRCILVVDDEKKLVRVLLIYSKGDLRSGNETAEWKMIIKNQFPEVGEKFRL